MASFNLSHPRVQSTLEKHLIVKRSDENEKSVNTVAIRGLEILGPSASSSLPKLEAAIRLIKEEGYASNDMIHCSLAILAVDPDNKKAIDQLLKGLGGSGWERNSSGVSDSIVSALKEASQDQRLTIRAAAEQGLSAIQIR